MSLKITLRSPATRSRVATLACCAASLFCLLLLPHMRYTLAAPGGDAVGYALLLSPAARLRLVGPVMLLCGDLLRLPATGIRLAHKLCSAADLPCRAPGLSFQDEA